MTETVGFDVTADVDGALARLRQFGAETERAFDRITAAAKRMEDVTARAERTMGGAGRGLGGLGDAGRGSNAPSSSPPQRQLEAHWDRLYGRGAQRDLRESIATMRRYQEAMHAAGQAGKRLADIDFNAGDLGRHRAALERLETAWRGHLSDPRNASLRGTLASYGLGHLTAPDALGQLGSIYGERAPHHARRILSDLSGRMGGAGGGLPPVGGGDEGGGGGVGAAALGVGKRMLGPLAAMYGVSRLIGEAVSAVKEAGAWAVQMDPLFRSTGADNFSALAQGIKTARQGSPVALPEFTALSQLYAGSTADRGAGAVLGGTQAGAGLAVGAGFAPAIGVGTMAAADFWSGGRQGKQELAAMIAEGLERSRSVQQGGEVLQQFSSWMAQTGSAGAAPNMGAWWETYTRLSQSGPVGQGTAGAGLIEQLTQGMRASRDNEEQLIFTARALQSQGVNKGFWGIRSLLDQGPFADIGSGMTMAEAKIAQFRKEQGALEQSDPDQFFGRMANMLGMDTAAQAKAVAQAFGPHTAGGAGGLPEWVRRYTASGKTIAPNAMPGLAEIANTPDDKLFALYLNKWKENIPEEHFKQLTSRFQWGVQDPSPDLLRQRREALMEVAAKGMARTAGGDIAQSEADKASKRVGDFGSALKEAIPAVNAFQESLWGAASGFGYLRPKASELGPIDIGFGIPNAAPAQNAMLIQAMFGGMGGLGGEGGDWGSGGGGIVKTGYGGGIGNPGKAGKGGVSSSAVYRYLRSKGVSRTHALGMLANIRGESNFRHGVLGDGGDSYGLFQYQGSRRSGLFAAAGGTPTWEEQIDYALSEPEGRGYLGREFANPEDAAEWFTRQFERPANPDRDARMRRGYARDYEEAIPVMPPAPNGARMAYIPDRAEIEIAVSLKDRDTGRALTTDPPRTVVRLKPSGVSPHTVG